MPFIDSSSGIATKKLQQPLSPTSDFLLEMSCPNSLLIDSIQKFLGEQAQVVPETSLIIRFYRP